MTTCSSRSEAALDPLPSPVRSPLSVRRPSPHPECKMVTCPGLPLLRQPLPWYTLQRTDRWLSGCVPSLPSPPRSFTRGHGPQRSMYETFPHRSYRLPAVPTHTAVEFGLPYPLPPPGPLHRRRPMVSRTLTRGPVGRQPAAPKTAHRPLLCRFSQLV